MKISLRNTGMITAFLALTLCACANKPQVAEPRFLASSTVAVTLYTISEEGVVSPSGEVVRGTEVRAYPASVERHDKIRYVVVELDGESCYVPEQALVVNREESVREDSVYVRTPVTILKDLVSSEIVGFADKSTALSVVGFDVLREDGTVGAYKVAMGKKEGYVYSKYVVFTPEEAAQRYDSERLDKIHGAVRNPFGGGQAIGCDFFPVEKPHFESNVMPHSRYALYLNASSATLSKIEAYIALAKQTRINTFVVDIKDNEVPGYKAEAMKRYSPTNYRRAGDNEKLYKRVVDRLHEEGFYAVGRITCFKDTYFVNDNPSCAITGKADGQPFKHNKSFWPSAYDRRVWEFNVVLAREAVQKFGFDEINFDYVRFPDRMNSIEQSIDYHNTYGESKVQAIQRFVTYACDEIHKDGAYVSVDVFGEVANPNYTTAYGQYWPAISNVVDAICGMPYPDHFTDKYYGVSKPWNNPYRILNAWGRRVVDRQGETTSPAVALSWVQAYNVMRHVDPNGIAYDAANVEKEIRGLFDAGVTGGYITWLSSSNIEKYRTQADAFKIDYYDEWRNPPVKAVEPEPESVDDTEESILQ